MQKRGIPPELIAPCGMNCGICVAFFGYTLGGKERKHPCDGCRSRVSLHRLRRDRCAFIKQHCDRLSTGKIDYCFECTDFPCANLETLDNRYRNKYGMSMIENLLQIQSQGIKQFVKSEQQRWKCPNCGGTICIHNKTCYTCRQNDKTKF